MYEEVEEEEVRVNAGGGVCAASSPLKYLEYILDAKKVFVDFYREKYNSSPRNTYSLSIR